MHCSFWFAFIPITRYPVLSLQVRVIFLLHSISAVFFDSSRIFSQGEKQNQMWIS